MRERSSKMRFIFNAFLFITLAFGLAIPMQTALAAVGPAEVWVDGTSTCTGHDLGTDCFATIQQGIDAVAPSGTVNVLAGTLDVTATILVNKSVTISGEAGAIVQGTNPAVVSIFEISASDVTLQNLEITHSALPVFVSTGWAELPNSLVRVPVSLGLTGLSIQDNKIYVPAQAGEMKTWNGVGITVGSSTTSGVSITGNTIYNVRDGAVVQYGNFATLNANDIYDTKGGIMNYTSSQADADNRTVSNNTWGTTHNEWDIVWNSAYYVPDYNASVLVLSGANNDAYVLDRRAADAAACAALTGNRSHIFVDATGAAVAAHPAKGNFNEPFATVQLGVDAVVPGGTVYVDEGTYTEQVNVTKSVNLLGEGAGSSIIAAPASLPASSNQTSYIMRFDGAGVIAELTGFTVTGPGPSGCGSIAAGILVSGGADAYIHDNTIVDVRDSTFSGCQNGIAIQVGRNAWATTGTATIENNIVTGYQKGGIVVDNTGSGATITGNTVTGAGTTDVTAQNGIQISRGASATLTGNTVTGNSFHLVGNAWDWGASGILLYQAGAVSMAGGNSVHDNDLNLYLDATAFTAGSESIGPSTAPLYYGYEVANMSALNFDLTSVTFSEATNCQIEERTWHGVDDTSYGLVTWLAGNLFVASPESTIQNAIDLATAGDNIKVCAGTYAENLNISKSLNIIGAQAGVNVGGRTAGHATEATIQGLVSVNASDVSVKGFTLTNPGGTNVITIPPTSSNTAISYNKIENVGATILSSNVHSIIFQNGADSVNISHNSFNNINANAKSASAIGVLDSASTDPSNGLVIMDNTFTNIGSVSKGAYGIIINNKAGAPGARIINNTFSGLNGNWTHAIGLETDVINPVVKDNNFSNLTVNAGSDVAAIFFEADPSSNTAFIRNNRFEGTAFYGVAIHPDAVALGYTATAVKNWWGDASGPGLIAEGTGALVGPNVDYTPWCTDMDCTSAFFLITGNINASDGTFNNRVMVTWDAIKGANRYILYRGTTAVAGDATELVSKSGTAYADRTAAPGVLYHYWVKACWFASCSDFSTTTDTGWRNLVATTNVQATDGAFSDKVQITWTAAPGATSFEVYRALQKTPAIRTLLGSPVAATFDDTTAKPGANYRYWVKSCVGVNCSNLGLFDRGWRKLAAPENLVASDGTFSDKVLVSWDASNEAFLYFVYRGFTGNKGDAVQIGQTKNTRYADRFAVPGATYHYWVTAASRQARESDFSNSDTGWR